MTLYEILGISPDATAEEIKSAYRRQAMRWHPDRNPENKDAAEQRFKDIGYAYSILSDPDKRRAYDEKLEQKQRHEEQDDFSSENAFSLFIAAILDVAFEMALDGRDPISIYQHLVAQGCPEAIAKTVAQRAYSMANKSPSSNEKAKGFSSRKNPGAPPLDPDNSTNQPDKSNLPRVSPARRWWARLFDLTFVQIFVFPIWFLFIAKQIGTNSLGLLVSYFSYVLLTFAFIGIIGVIAGNTPGKAILNIAVKHGDSIPSPSQYIAREFSVLLRGYWLSIPVVCLLPQLFAYQKLKAGKDTDWDSAGGFKVVPIRSEKPSILAYLIAFLVCSLLSNALVIPFTLNYGGGVNADSQASNNANRALSGATQRPNMDNSKGHTVAEQSTASVGADVVRIGVAAPMSGPQSHLGKDIENGVRLALAELNSRPFVVNGKSVRFDLVIADDMASPREGVIAAQSLVDAKVAAVIGHMNSGTTVPASKIYADAGIVQITPSATNPALTKQRIATTFRATANDHQQGRGIADFVFKQGARRVILVDDRTAYGALLADSFLSKALNIGISVVTRLYVQPTTTDFSSVLGQISAARPDAVIYAGMDEQLILLARQMQQYRISTALVGGDGACTPLTASIAGSGSRIFCSMPGAPLQTLSAGHEFERIFQMRFGAEVQLYAPNAYDATMIVAHGIQKSGTTSASILSEAIKSSTYNGILQTYQFADNGDLISAPISFYQAKNSKLEFLETLAAH